MSARRPSWRRLVLVSAAGALALAAVVVFAARRMLAEHDAADAQALLGGGAQPSAIAQAEQEAVQSRELEPDRAGSGLLVARAVVGGAIADGVMTGADRERLGQALDFLRSDLDARPDDGEAWLWLAYVETLRSDGQMDDLARKALRRSYESLPYPTLDLLLWRTRFSGDLWPQLDAGTRSMALERMSAAWGVAHARDQVEALQQEIRNPDGRAAIGLRLLALHAAQEKPDLGATGAEPPAEPTPAGEPRS